MQTVSDEQLVFSWQIDEALQANDSEALYRYAKQVRKDGEEEFAHSLFLAAKRAEKYEREEAFGHDELIGN